MKHVSAFDAFCAQQYQRIRESVERLGHRGERGCVRFRVKKSHHINAGPPPKVFALSLPRKSMS